MLPKFKNKGELWAMGFWFATPLLGQITAPFYCLAALVSRNQAGAFRSPLVAFFSLCCVYTAYIAFVSVLSGGWQTAIEPIGDAASLAITVGIATWALRFDRKLDLSRVFAGCCIVVFVVCIACVVAANVFDVFRPALLMQNPLNLSPTLLLPAIICTMFHWTPSRWWVLIGTSSFLLALATLSLVLQARGTVLVLLFLLLCRLIWVVFIEKSRWPRVLTTFALVAPIAIGGLVVTISQSLPARLSVTAHIVPDVVTTQPVASTHEPATPDQSVNERLAMLTAAWQTFLDKPFLGHGGQNRFEAVRPYLPERFAEFSHLHNEFLTHAVAGGIPAVGLLTLILAFPLLVALHSPERNREKIQIALLFCAAFTGTAMVNNVLFVDISAFSLGLSFVMAILMIETA